MYDVIVVGAGPAGLTAATNLANRGLKTLVLEKQTNPGGLPVLLYPDKIIKDHPGFPVGILGKELSRMLYMQATNSGAEIRCSEEVSKIEKVKEDLFVVTTVKEKYSGKRIILCTGVFNAPRKLEQLKGYNGPNVHYRVKEPEKFRDKKLVILGGGDHAFDTAVQLCDTTKSTTVLVRGEYAEAKAHTVETAEKMGVKVYYNTELVNIFENRFGSLEKGRIKNILTGDEKIIDAQEIFVAIGFIPLKEFLKNNGFEMKKDGSVKVSEKLETNIKGVFAAGDITGEVRVIATACAKGIIAAVHTFETIKKPYWLK